MDDLLVIVKLSDAFEFERANKDVTHRLGQPSTGSRNRSALSSAPLGPRTFRGLFLCADATIVARTMRGQNDEGARTMRGPER